MTPTAPPARRYVVWRVADFAAFKGRYRGGGDGWEKGSCPSCDKPVWHHPHRLGAAKRMVCWPCANTEDEA